MAEIEEAEHGETGALFEWLQRAQRAPQDPAWVADGVVSDHWAPVSPATGRLDAFEWKTPAEPMSRVGAVEHLRAPAGAEGPRLVSADAAPLEDARRALTAGRPVPRPRTARNPPPGSNPCGTVAPPH